MRKVKIGECLKVKHGWAFKGEYFRERGVQSILTPGNFYEKGGFKPNGGKERYYIGHYPQEYLCHKGDLIIAMTQQAEGLLGSTAIVPENGKYLHNQRIGLITCDESKLFPLFAYYLFMTKSVRIQLERSASGTKVKHTSPEKIYEVLVSLPEVEQQKNIATILYAVEEKENINKRINEYLEQQLRTIYDYWFTQFDFPDENGKPYRSSGGKMVWNEELKREIPEGWCVKKLSEILNVITGKEDANFSSLNGQYKFFTCSNTTLLCDEFAFDGKAVLIAGNGDFNVKHYSGKFNAYQRTYVLLPKEVLLRAPIYLVAKQMINRFVNGSNGSIVKFITKGDIENITIFIPHDLQLYKLLNDLLDAIEVNQQEIDQLIKLRDWLLPMLMNGQATVAD